MLKMEGVMVCTHCLLEEVCASSMVNIAKIVQPTATVSSVPVSGPTTGIARSIVPGQNIRSSGMVTAIPSNAVCIGASVLGGGGDAATTMPGVAAVSAPAVVTVIAPTPAAPSPAKMQPTATIQRAPSGSKYSALVAAYSLDQASAVGAMLTHPVPIAVPPVTVPPAGARGMPPPIPPNKPIVPPKREPSLSRLGSLTAAAAAAAAAGGASGAANLPAVAANLNAKIN